MKNILLGCMLGALVFLIEKDKNADSEHKEALKESLLKGVNKGIEHGYKAGANDMQNYFLDESGFHSCVKKYKKCNIIAVPKPKEV